MSFEFIDILEPPKKKVKQLKADTWKKFVSNKFLGLKKTFNLQESIL